MTTSATQAPVRGSFRGMSDLPLVGRQVYFEQLSFWLNPIGAAITIGFSVIFVVFFELQQKSMGHAVLIIVNAHDVAAGIDPELAVT